MQIKKDWKESDIVMPEDMNRIEGNIEAAKNQAKGSVQKGEVYLKNEVEQKLKETLNASLEKMQKGGLLSSVLTGFVKNSATGDITAGDTLANVLNKLQNRIKFGYGIVSGTEKITNMGEHSIEYILPFVPVAVVIGDGNGTVLLTQNGLKSSTHFGQRYNWMYSLSGNIVKVESRESIATEVTYFMI